MTAINHLGKPDTVSLDFGDQITLIATWDTDTSDCSGLTAVIDGYRGSAVVEATDDGATAIIPISPATAAAMCYQAAVDPGLVRVRSTERYS
jgi:hypothetical protein